MAGCSREIKPEQLAGATMGTTWQVSYIEPPSEPGPDRLQSGIENLLEKINLGMSTYLSESQISQFNALATNVWFSVSPEFFQVLSTALEVGRRSEGAYDVTVAPLVDLWGFGPGGPVLVHPTAEEVAVLLGRVGQGKLRLDSEALRVMKLSELSLDFSSLAKGYAVDQVAEWLMDQGVDRFMVEVGGEMRLSGLSGRDDLWRIAIEQPESSGRSVAVAVNLTNTAIATSGDYRNYFEAGGKRYSHMIDPRSGYPIEHDLVSVTVVYANCMTADAWATALSVLGAQRAMAVAQAQGLAVYFIRRVGDEFVHSHTPLFSSYLEEPGT